MDTNGCVKSWFNGQPQGFRQGFVHGLVPGFVQRVGSMGLHERLLQRVGERLLQRVGSIGWSKGLLTWFLEGVGPDVCSRDCSGVGSRVCSKVGSSGLLQRLVQRVCSKSLVQRYGRLNGVVQSVGSICWFRGWVKRCVQAVGSKCWFKGWLTS